VIYKSSSIISTIELRIEKFFEGDSSGHDYHHVNRVRCLALQLAKKENADLFVVELIALLHDIGDWKFHDRGLNGQAEILAEFLKDLNIEKSLLKRILIEIPKIGFKGAEVKEEDLSLEAQIVRDADRIDAIGAIGIARCFAYGGHKGMPIYDPNVAIAMHNNAMEYHSAKSPSIHHFFEKLLLLKDRLHTKSGQQLAEDRHQFLLDFLLQFFREWYGEDEIPKQFNLNRFELKER
tara:strand:- start:2551 stop:3258 length:708 start_codon:yes stop_codon:yes gene_type:complete